MSLSPSTRAAISGLLSHVDDAPNPPLDVNALLRPWGDFPYLAQIGGHEDEPLAEYAQAVMTAAPWPD
jgi:hypothetical protein